MGAVSIPKEKKSAVIHSNSTGFVKLLLSICHHRSNLDLAFLGAVLPAQFCFLIIYRRPREGRRPIRNQQNNLETTLLRERRGKATPLGLACQRRSMMWTIMRANSHRVSTVHQSLPQSALQQFEVGTTDSHILHKRSWA